MIVAIILGTLAVAGVAAMAILRRRGVFLFEVLPADGDIYDITIKFDK